MKKLKPLASQVLTGYLKSQKCPHWTSFFVSRFEVDNDQFGMSHFNWEVQPGANYHVLRTGCFPFIKYHCTRRPYDASLAVEDKVIRVLKCLNLGIPTVVYGIAAFFLIKHVEILDLQGAQVKILFLIEEDKNSSY